VHGPRKPLINSFFNNFPKNIIFPKGFLHTCMKNDISDLKFWGPLKNHKNRSGSYSDLGLSVHVKKSGMKISSAYPLNVLCTHFCYKQYV
jgi:hypothetical protein